MRKHGIDLEDTTRGDGSRPKRLDRKDLDALMGGDGPGGIFTWREKNCRKVSIVSCSLEILVPVLKSSLYRIRQLAYSVWVQYLRSYG